MGTLKKKLCTILGISGTIRFNCSYLSPFFRLKIFHNYITRLENMSFKSKTVNCLEVCLCFCSSNVIQKVKIKKKKIESIKIARAKPGEIACVYILCICITLEEQKQRQTYIYEQFHYFSALFVGACLGMAPNYGML